MVCKSIIIVAGLKLQIEEKSSIKLASQSSRYNQAFDFLG